MEFGVFVQSYVPGFRMAVDPDAEHHAILHDVELIKAADRAGFKYVWVTEHHFLHEYSHMSANDAFIGYLASCTDRIHLGSGIFNPLPQVNHPVKVAERAAMLDHLSDGRFEFGTGRGAGSHEILGFSVGDLTEMEPVVSAYKKEIPNAEPVGAYVNDNVMVTSAAFIDEDHDRAVKSAVDGKLSYLQSNVFRYHDTFPHPEQVPYWPDLIPDYDRDVIEGLIQIGGLICGDPDEALEQCRRWESAGADQLVFGSGMATLDEELETIRLLGEHVIPKIDTDPVHRTSRFRDAAAG